MSERASYAVVSLALAVGSGCRASPPRWPRVAPGARSVSFIYGVADAATATAYIMGDRDGGGVDAVDLATGARRWHTDDAMWPLLVMPDGNVVAEAKPEVAGALRLVLLDRSTGTSVVTSQPVGVPDWACPAACPACGGWLYADEPPRGPECDFRLGAALGTDGTVRVDWACETWKQVTDDGQPQVDQRALGAVRVDLRPGAGRGPVTTPLSPASEPAEWISPGSPGVPARASCAGMPRMPPDDDIVHAAVVCLGTYVFYEGSYCVPGTRGYPCTEMERLTGWDSHTGREVWHRDLWYAGDGHPVDPE